MTSERLHAALGRQVLFSAIILAIEVPLGIFIALNMPKRGFWASLCLVLMALPLLIPFNVVGTIWQIFGRVDIGLLGHTLEGAGLPFQVRGLRGGYTLMTTPELGQVLARLAKGPTVERISAAALETLAIVAYRQPVTKAEIESIRGVQAGPILRTLVDRGLVKVVGRADVPGHPLQYGTGKEFLDRFGLMSLDELPRDAELARG